MEDATKSQQRSGEQRNLVMELKCPRKLAPIAATIMALFGLLASFFMVAGHQRANIVVTVITVEVVLIALAIFQWCEFLTKYISFEIDRHIYLFSVKMEAQRKLTKSESMPDKKLPGD